MPDAPNRIVTLQRDTKREYIVRETTFPVFSAGTQLAMHTKTLVTHAAYDPEDYMIRMYYLEPVDGTPKEWLVMAFGKGKEVDLCQWTYLTHAGPYLIFRQNNHA